MKKIGKKLSYITKVFLAIGLLFNNLSSLSIVFADEINPDDGSAVVVTTPDSGSGTQTVAPDSGSGDNGEGKMPEGGDNGNVVGNPSDPTSAPTADPTQTPTGDPVDPTEETKPVEESVELKFEVSVNENVIVVKHNKALDLSEESELVVVEDFKYLDETYYGAEEHKVTLTEDVRTALVSEEGYSIDSIILPENVYAGEYSVNAYVGEDQALTSKVIEAEGEGIEFKLYTPSEEEVKAEEDGVYYFEDDATGFVVTARLLNGGISPSDKITIGEEEIVASELFEEGVILEETFEGYLHGEFEYKVSVDYSLGGNAKTAEEVFDIFYLNYSNNTDGLNESAKNVGLDSKYVFVGGYADNIVYNLGSEEIEEILKDFVGEDGIITYEINNDNGLVVTLTDGRVTITYEEATLDSDRTLDARLEADSIEVSTGDTLTVKYLVTLNDDPINGVSGLVKYDQELLKLTNIESSVFDGGGNKDDAFLYAQWVMLQADTEEDEDGNITYKPTDYTLVTLTFEALKAGEATINVEDAKFYQRDVYLEPADELGVSVTITESADNSLASLMVAGQEIELVDDQLEYEITVSNDVTKADIEAVVNNSSASITSMVYPEELAEGENTITIVVTAANGEKREYKVTVTREAKEEETKEEESTVSPIAYTDNAYTDDDSNDNDNQIVPVDDGDDKDDDKTDEKDAGKENNLSRIIIIILILLVIAGLIYLIFKDDGDEEEKQANHDINKFKKDDDFDTQPKKNEQKPNNKNNNRNRNTQNNKKGR